MRLLRTLAPLVTIVALAAPAAASDVSTSMVAVNVLVSARTSLQVSSEMLQFVVPDGGSGAEAAVTFRAGARVDRTNDVVLTVEPVTALEGPGGAADVEGAVTFAGDGMGTTRGSLVPAGPTVAGRWHGSGLREGRLVFTLHASAGGSYTLPVRFVLSTP
jgi:hypothetical protein